MKEMLAGMIAILAAGLLGCGLVVLRGNEQEGVVALDPFWFFVFSIVLSVIAITLGVMAITSNIRRCLRQRRMK